MQVSTLSIFCMAVSAVCSVLIPVGLLVFFRKKLGASVAAFFAGCLTFFVAVMVLESILHRLVLTSPLGAVIQGNTWLYALYGGLAAGVFEETGRLIAMKILKKKHNSTRTCLMYGAGHGGIEVLLILGVGMAQNLFMAQAINSGAIAQLLAPLEGAELAAINSQLQALIATPAPYFLVGIVERLSAVVLHIGLSVLVWQAAVKPGKLWMYVAAIGLHALADALAVILQGLGTPIWAIECAIAVFALAVAFLAGKLYRRDSAVTQ